MAGLEVTPTTWLFFTRSARLPVSSRSRERSSSQMDTPASARALRRSFMWSLQMWGGSVGQGAQAVAGRVGDRLAGDVELLVDPGEVSRGAVVVDGDDAAVVADVLPPSLLDAGLDRDAGLDGGRQDALAVGLLLLLEPLEAGERHHARADAVGGEELAGGDCHLHLGAGAHEDHVGLALVDVEQDVAAAVHVGGVAEAVLAAREDRDVLAGERDAGRVVGAPEHGG